MPVWKDRINGRIYHDKPFDYWFDKSREEWEEGIKTGDIEKEVEIELRNGKYMGTWTCYFCKGDFENTLGAYRDHDPFLAKRFEEKDKLAA